MAPAMIPKLIVQYRARTPVDILRDESFKRLELRPLYKIVTLQTIFFSLKNGKEKKEQGNFKAALFT